MAAFTGYDPIDRDRSKYAGYDVSRLKALDPRNAPSPAPAGAASQGALGAPAAAGETPAFASAMGDEGKGVGEARKPKAGSDFFSMWKDASEEDRAAVADNIDSSLKPQGIDLQRQAEKIAESDPAAAQLAARYGYSPKDGAFAGKGKNGKWDRNAWGGFLMEVGLRILASNREDAGGAIGEGVLGTMDARRTRAKEDAAETEYRRKTEREETRQDEADERARAAEDRAQAVHEREMETGDLVQIETETGEVIFVDKRAGYVTDENGKRIRKATQNDLSAAQRETNKRAYAQARARARTAIEKAVGEGYSTDPAIQEIIEIDDVKERNRMIDDMVDRMMERDEYDVLAEDEGGAGVIDYSTL